MEAVEEARSVDALDQELSQVRIRLVELLGEIDDVTLREMPLVRMEYELKIGVWETERAKCELDARRAKRRYQLAQAKVNRGDKPDFQAIEETLDAELEAWTARVEERRAYLQENMEMRAALGVLSSVQARELKKLHRKLVMRLHPDLNPQDFGAHRLFALVQAAYEKGDLDLLRTLDVASADFADRKKDEEARDEEALFVNLELAKAQAVVLQERLDSLKATEPYVFRDLLWDPAWVESRVAPLRAQIEELRLVRDAYERRTDILKEESDER